jgi:hypothetical protein
MERADDPQGSLITVVLTLHDCWFGSYFYSRAALVAV